MGSLSSILEGLAVGGLILFLVSVAPLGIPVYAFLLWWLYARESDRVRRSGLRTSV